MPFASRQFVPVALAIIVLNASVSLAQVKVIKQPAVIERKTFDPKNRPKEMPEVRGNEEAVTSAKFQVKTQVGFTPGTAKQGKAGGWTASIRTQSLQVELSLSITIWLPEGVSEKLTAHEEGHRQVAEQVYKTADKVAAKIGETYIGRGGNGTGDTKEAAQIDALKTLMQSCANDILTVTDGKAQRVNDIYDELTLQGTKPEPSEFEAIPLAFKQQEKEEADLKKMSRPKAK